MRTLARVAAIPAVAAALLLGACGSERTADGSATTATTAQAVATTVAATPTVVEEPASGDIAEITVKVGADDSPTRVEQVRLGQEVVIVLQSDQDEEYHLHGFDITQRAAAGTEAALSFTADQPGRFELESHTTGNVLLVLEVVG